jgi:hypothetical protein
MNDEQMQILCDWFRDLEERGQQGRGLADHEIALARRVGVEDVARVRVMEVSEMPAVPSELEELSKQHLNLNHAVGLTVGHVVYIIKGNLNAPLLKHECRHVYQVEQYPDTTTWLKVYVEQVLAVGYEDAPFEIDARNYEQA